MSEALEQSDVQDGYKEVEFGPKTLVIPRDWTTGRFGEVFHRRRESIDDIEDETVRYVGLKHIDSGQLAINGYDEDGRERSSSRVFREGDILFGKLRPNLNKAAVAPFSGVCSSDIIPIHAEEDARQQYLPYLMHSKLVRDRVVSTMEGTNLPRTSWSDLEKTVIPLPPLPEQRRIADILSTIDGQIQQTDVIIEETRELKRGLAQQLLDKGTQDESKTEVDIGPLTIPLPKSWELTRLENFPSPASSVVQTGPYGSKLQKDEFTDSGYKVYRQANINAADFSKGSQYVTEAKYRDLEKYQVTSGDVLLTRMGTIGDAAVLPEGASEGIMDYHLFRIRIDQSFCLSEYLGEVLRSSRIVKHQIESFSHGAIMDGLNTGLINELRIPVPPIEEQRKVVDILSTVDHSKSLEQKRKKQLKQLKRGLMQDLLTGKVRVNPDN